MLNEEAARRRRARVPAASRCWTGLRAPRNSGVWVWRPMTAKAWLAILEAAGITEFVRFFGLQAMKSGSRRQNLRRGTAWPLPLLVNLPPREIVMVGDSTHVCTPAVRRECAIGGADRGLLVATICHFCGTSFCVTSVEIFPPAGWRRAPLNLRSQISGLYLS